MFLVSLVIIKMIQQIVSKKFSVKVNRIRQTILNVALQNYNGNQISTLQYKPDGSLGAFL